MDFDKPQKNRNSEKIFTRNCWGGRDSLQETAGEVGIARDAKKWGKNKAAQL